MQADARAHLTDDVVLFRKALVGNDQRDRPADGLVGRVAEHPLRGLVPAGDDPVEILADDRVV
jgi:hypothetical protein